MLVHLKNPKNNNKKVLKTEKKFPLTIDLKSSIIPLVCVCYVSIEFAAKHKSSAAINYSLRHEIFFLKLAFE